MTYLPWITNDWMASSRSNKVTELWTIASVFAESFVTSGSYSVASEGFLFTVWSDSFGCFELKRLYLWFGAVLTAELEPCQWEMWDRVNLLFSDEGRRVCQGFLFLLNQLVQWASPLWGSLATRGRVLCTASVGQPDCQSVSTHNAAGIVKNSLILCVCVCVWSEQWLRRHF